MQCVSPKQSLGDDVRLQTVTILSLPHSRSIRTRDEVVFGAPGANVRFSTPLFASRGISHKMSRDIDDVRHTALEGCSKALLPNNFVSCLDGSLNST